MPTFRERLLAFLEANADDEETEVKPDEDIAEDDAPDAELSDADARIAALEATIAELQAKAEAPPAAAKSTTEKPASAPKRSVATRTSAVRAKPDISKMNDKERYDYWKKEMLPALTKEPGTPAEQLREAMKG